MEKVQYKELPGYIIVPVNNHIPCQAPQDACKDCSLCSLYHLHYEKVGIDGLCDSERSFQEKLLKEKQQNLLKYNMKVFITLIILFIGVIQLPITACFFNDNVAVFILVISVLIFVGFGFYILYSYLK